MVTGYKPNIEGAIAVLVDLMTANGVTMTVPDGNGTLVTQDFATATAVALG